jgi:hypothetical protein
MCIVVCVSHKRLATAFQAYVCNKHPSSTATASTAVHAFMHTSCAAMLHSTSRCSFAASNVGVDLGVSATDESHIVKQSREKLKVPHSDIKHNATRPMCQVGSCSGINLSWTRLPPVVPPGARWQGCVVRLLHALQTDAEMLSPPPADSSSSSTAAAAIDKKG